MKYIISVLFVILSFNSHGEECRNFTDEQINTVYRAYHAGFPHNYGYTLAAIAIKESFVGDSIIRINPNDPSYGIMHVTAKTTHYLLGEEVSYWDRVKLIERSVFDDELSFALAIAKLNSIKSDDFRVKWKRYNGSGEQAEKYSESIAKIVSGLKKCFSFNPEY